MQWKPSERKLSTDIKHFRETTWNRAKEHNLQNGQKQLRQFFGVADVTSSWRREGKTKQRCFHYAAETDNGFCNTNKGLCPKQICVQFYASFKVSHLLVWTRTICSVCTTQHLPKYTTCHDLPWSEGQEIKAVFLYGRLKTKECTLPTGFT